MGKLAGRVAMVTGAGSGLGREIALAFGRAGGRVIVLDIRDGAADAVAAEVQAAGGRALHSVCDVASPDEVEKSFVSAVAEFGRVDIVVNNAALFNFAAFVEERLEDWRRVFSVNVEGPLLMTQAAARVMAEQDPLDDGGARGQLINVTSFAANVGRPFLASYGASKAALNHLSKTSTDALGPLGISTTVLCPAGFVSQGMSATLLRQLAAAEGRDVDELISDRRSGSPGGEQSLADVAEIALFIASSGDMRFNGMVVWSAAYCSAL